MPDAMKEVLGDLIYGLSRLQQKQPEYEEAKAFYDGDDPELFVSDALRVYLRDSVRAFRLNMAAVSVDSVADRLYVSRFTSPDDRTQAEIDRIVEENSVWLWLNDVLRDGEMYGDDYIGVWMDPADGRPLLSPVDPLTTMIIYDNELERIPLYMVRHWRVSEEEERATISYPNEIYKFHRLARGGDWVPYEVEGETFPLVNILNDIPAGHLRNGLPYGSPGHKKSYGMQEIITKGILNMMANVDFMGFKQRYALKNPNDIGDLPAPAPRTKDGVATGTAPRGTELTAGPGKLWKLSAESVGEFSPTDVEEFVKLLDWAIIAMARAERLPIRLFADQSGQEPSGESQRESDKSLRDRVAARKRSFGAGLVNTMKKALLIAGVPDAIVEVEWSREEIATEAELYAAANSAMDLIERAILNPALRPFVEQKLRELGYSEEEIVTFFGSVTDSKGVTNDPGTGELDGANVEG